MKRNNRRFINFIDVVFVLIAILMVAGFYLFFKREKTFIEVKIKVTDDNPLYATTFPSSEYASSFFVGDVEKNEIGKTIVSIKKVDSYRINARNNVVYLTLDLEAIYNPKKKQYSFQGKPLIFGESHTFSFTNAKVKGIVVDFPGSHQQKKNLTAHVTAQLRYDDRQYSDVYGVPEFIATAVKEGDEVKDSGGKVLAKVIEIKILPAQRTVVSSNGQVFVVNDPQLKDVYYLLELSAYEINNQKYMFDYLPLDVGEIVPLNFGTVKVFPTITNINSIEEGS